MRLFGNWFAPPELPYPFGAATQPAANSCTGRKLLGGFFSIGEGPYPTAPPHPTPPPAPGTPSVAGSASSSGTVGGTASGGATAGASPATPADAGGPIESLGWGKTFATYICNPGFVADAEDGCTESEDGESGGNGV